MRNSDTFFDALIVGGGFYGAVIAIYLAKQHGLQRIILVEQESELLTRASFNNQARVHNGYHYPRSFTTAYRSRVNFPRFVHDWPDAIRKNFTKLYAISRRNSKVTSRQFRRFCSEIGASIYPADQALRALFEPHLIEDVFLVEEHVFDALELARRLKDELTECGVHVICDTHVAAIERTQDKMLQASMRSKLEGDKRLTSRYVFNCTYSGINQIKGDFSGVRTGLKQEITEMALVEVPQVLAELGVTVMDGPFFSLMPFPAKGLHTLSHVRYTPHLHWDDQVGVDPYQRLHDYERVTRVDRMLRDARRYMPALRGAKYMDSLFEVKTVLAKNEADDGRPILFEKHSELPGCYSVLGGKIDNVYDVLEKLENESFERR